MQLLAACQKAPGLERLVVKSSSEVYGSSSRDPAMFTEDMGAKRLPALRLRQGRPRGRGLRPRLRPPASRRRRHAAARRQHRRARGLRPPLSDYFRLPGAPSVARVRRAAAAPPRRRPRRRCCTTRPSAACTAPSTSPATASCMLSQALRRLGPADASRAGVRAQRWLGSAVRRARLRPCRQLLARTQLELPHLRPRPRHHPDAHRPGVRGPPHHREARSRSSPRVPPARRSLRTHPVVDRARTPSPDRPGRQPWLTPRSSRWAPAAAPAAAAAATSRPRVLARPLPAARGARPGDAAEAADARAAPPSSRRADPPSEARHRATPRHEGDARRRGRARVPASRVRRAAARRATGRRACRDRDVRRAAARQRRRARQPASCRAVDPGARERPPAAASPSRDCSPRSPARRRGVFGDDADRQLAADAGVPAAPGDRRLRGRRVRPRRRGHRAVPAWRPCGRWPEVVPGRGPRRREHPRRRRCAGGLQPLRHASRSTG